MHGNNKYSFGMNPEVVMLTEHMQMVAGYNRLLEVQGYAVVIEGVNTEYEVEVSKMSEEKIEMVIAEISKSLYEKFNRTVTKIGNKLFVSAPHLVEEAI